MCSDSCWVRARGRRQPQTASLDRAMMQFSDQATRHLNFYRPSRVQADGVLDSRTVARYLAERQEGLAVVARARSRGRSLVSRSSGVYGAPGDCADCRKCGFTPEQSRSVHEGWTALTMAGHLNVPAGDTSYRASW